MQIDAIGIVSSSDLMTYDVYMHEISRGVPENLGYLQKNASCRRDFEALMPGTRSVVCCMFRMPDVLGDLAPHLARFCGFGDYHAVVRSCLMKFGEMLCADFGVTKFRVCVDSAPILERELAVRAGLGSIGFHRTVIHPEWGSHVVLGEILVDIDLTGQASALEKLCHTPKDVDLKALLTPGGYGCCGEGHRRCVRACPTGALHDRGYEMGRCLAYWTTQHKGEIPEFFAQAMGECLWGCDRCQQACPRVLGRAGKAVRMAQVRHSDAAQAYADEDRIARASIEQKTGENGACDEILGETVGRIQGMTWAEMLKMSAGQLRRNLAETAMGGAHPYMVQRNLCIVIGNLRIWHYESVLHEVVQSHGCEWVQNAAKRALIKIQGG